MLDCPPESRNDKALQEQGKVTLSKNLGDKRGASDVAMWKKSKAREPVWPSPWGKGRPGWHIESSMIASDVLGSQMDIHSGGIDVAFPYYDMNWLQARLTSASIACFTAGSIISCIWDIC